LEEHFWCGHQDHLTSHNAIFEITATLTQVQNAAIDCDEIQIGVLMNRGEYKKKKKSRIISNEIPFNNVPSF